MPQGLKPLPLSNICNNKILGILHFLMIHVYYWKVSNKFYDNDKRKWKRFEQGLDPACVTIRTKSFTPTPHIQQYNLGNYALCLIHIHILEILHIWWFMFIPEQQATCFIIMIKVWARARQKFYMFYQSGIRKYKNVSWFSYIEKDEQV